MPQPSAIQYRTGTFLSCLWTRWGIAAGQISLIISCAASACPKGKFWAVCRSEEKEIPNPKNQIPKKSQTEP